jgi:hypothetical protein
MAKTINSGANVVTTQTFTAWLDVTNEMARAFANVISVDLETFPSGTAGVNGAFVANTLTVTTGLLTANASAVVSGNLSVSESILLGANTIVANTTTITVGNSTIFTAITKEGMVVGDASISGNLLFVGNTTVNTSISSSLIFTSGSITAEGNLAVSGDISTGGNLSISGAISANNLGINNIDISGMITANGSAGLEGQVLRSDGVKVYWGVGSTGEDGGAVDISAGDGLIKTGDPSFPTISVLANSGIIANTTGLYVDASTVSVGILPVTSGGTGANTFTEGALLKGNTDGAIQVASAADIVGQIGTTRVANAVFANTAGIATISTSANVATNTVITNDISSAATVYPVWVDGTSSNRANKVSSTKLRFNPSTGILTATGFSGNGASVTSVTAASTTGTLTRGTYLTGNNFNGSGSTTWNVDATSDSTASKIVARDSNRSFSANVVNVNVLNTSSDIQLKSNLVIITDPIEKVKALNGYTYDRVGSLVREAGVVAQEVQSVLPEVVSQENGYLSVAYGNMVALLIEAIKDQQKQIDELKKKLGE